MLRERKHRSTRLRPAEVPRIAIPLPERLAQLVNPAVREARRARVEQLLQDASETAQRRERYVRTIVDHHLWTELSDA